MRFDSVKTGLRVWHLGLVFLALYFVLFAVFTHWAEPASFVYPVVKVGEPISLAYYKMSVSKSFPEVMGCGTGATVIHDEFEAVNGDGSAADGLRISGESEEFAVAFYIPGALDPSMIYFAAKNGTVTRVWLAGERKPDPCDLVREHLKAEGKL